MLFGQPTQAQQLIDAEFILKQNQTLLEQNQALKDEIFKMQKDHESLKASHYYKASSLEGKLEAHVEQSV